MMLLSLLGLFACGSNPPTRPEGAPSMAAAAPTPEIQQRHATNVGKVAKHRASLLALGWFEVSSLIVDAPPSTNKCFGPCADNPADVVWAHAYHAQAERIAQLVAMATEVDGTENPPTTDVTGAMATLEALKIVSLRKPNVDDPTVRAKISALAVRAAKL